MKSTFSVRKAHSLFEELWLDSKGKWDDFENRKRFNSQDEAEYFVATCFVGLKFGIFPN